MMHVRLPPGHDRAHRSAAVGRRLPIGDIALAAALILALIAASAYRGSAVSEPGTEAACRTD